TTGRLPAPPRPPCSTTRTSSTHRPRPGPSGNSGGAGSRRRSGSCSVLMTAVVLALAAAALWGTGDFLRRLATRRVNVLIVLLWSQLAGLAGVVAWIVITGDSRPGGVLAY